MGAFVQQLHNPEAEAKLKPPLFKLAEDFRLSLAADRLETDATNFV
jgi:hypothetical protein